MGKTRYDDAKKNVESIFPQPRDLLVADDLTKSQKIELLKLWEIDQRRLLVAAEEGMEERRPGRSAEILRQIQSALSAIED